MTLSILSNRSANVYSNGVHVLPTHSYVICSFSYLSDLDVHLLQIRICCYKSHHTTDSTLHRVRNHFHFIFVTYSLTNQLTNY
jgi:hypothetical protein